MTRPPPLPRNRLCQPPDEWSPLERLRWAKAKTPGKSLLDEDGSRLMHSVRSNKNLEKSYGRFKVWDREQDDFDRQAPPGAQITPERVGRFAADLEKINSVSTVIQRLIELKVAAEIVADPEKDWSWIYLLVSRLRWRCEPARSKRHRLRDINELWSLGLSLMDAVDIEDTPLRRFKMYRDGLLIALLAALPILRLANLTGLILDHTLIQQGGVWLIKIPAAEVKTRVPIEVAWPRMVTPHLEVYLSKYRSWVLGLQNNKSAHSSDALWLTMYGHPMRDNGIYQRVVARTREAFGHPITPHLFRDCAATTTAIQDPEHVRITAPLLHHRRFSTTEKYYIQAVGLEASRAVQDCLLSLRRNMKRPSSKRAHKSTPPK